MFQEPKYIFISRKQKRNHWNPAAPVKNVSLLSFIFTADEAEHENNQRIYIRWTETHLRCLDAGLLSGKLWLAAH